MVADAIWDCSHRKEVVRHAFIGFGTTLIAAEETGRRAAESRVETDQFS
jgi:DNA modification methylase